MPCVLSSSFHMSSSSPPERCPYRSCHTPFSAVLVFFLFLFFLFSFLTQNETDGVESDSDGVRHAQQNLHQLTLETIPHSGGLRPSRAREVWSHHRRGNAARRGNCTGRCANQHATPSHAPRLFGAMAKSLTNFLVSSDRRPPTSRATTTSGARPPWPRSSR